MSDNLERCVKKVKKQGKTKSSAFAICNATLGKKKKKSRKTKK